MSDTASNPKELTRHIVVHRRRTPYRRFKRFLTRVALTATISFLATAIIVDTLHPRTLTPASVAALANLLHHAHPSPAVLQNASIPLRHAAHHTTTAIIGNPPTLVTKHLLYWTPVESLTLLTYPASPPILHHAVPITLHHHPLSKLTITPLRSEPSPIIHRFTPYLIHPLESATILEHADGFLPARALQTAFYSAVITMHPRLILDALAENSALFLRYFQSYLPRITIPEPLGWARRISRTARDRRARKANLSQKAT